MKIVRESHNLYRLARLGMVNCFLVREPDGFTLVDTGLPSSGKDIIQEAQKLEGTIRAIALTHAHFDHVGSVDEILAVLPGVKFFVGAREARFLSGDLSLLPGESGKKLLGFSRVAATPTKLLKTGDEIGSLRVVNSPGHTPGHISFLDSRDNGLIAGDAFMTQAGVTAAGVLKLYFPFAALFSWNGTLSAESAADLKALDPSLLAVGHGKSVKSPAEAMDRAVKEAFRQHPDAVRR
jgi:glyoxylase-like metal-dependent hydrolase (beta-lactamase superfamily II)